MGLRLHRLFCFRYTGPTVLLLVLTVALSVAQAEHAHPAPVSAVALELAQRPVPMRTGIGSAHDA